MDGMRVALLLLAGLIGMGLTDLSGLPQESGGSPEAPKSSQTAPPNGAPDAKGVYRVGGLVRAPVLVYRVDPEYSEKARKKKISADIQVDLVIDAKGVPKDEVVMNPAGYGLDEAAIKAVSQYRFKPALREGVAVPVYISIGVSFHIY